MGQMHGGVCNIQMMRPNTEWGPMKKGGTSVFWIPVAKVKLELGCTIYGVVITIFPIQLDQLD